MIPCRTQVWKPTARTEQYWKAIAVPHWEKYIARLGQPKMSDVEMLMCTANALPFGHPMLHEFMILCWQHWWGDKLQIESQGIINHWLVRIVKGLCSEKILDIMGAASSGKTYIVAAYGYTMWKLRPHETSVFLSTTSAEAGESRTWGAVKELHTLDTSRVGKRIDSLRLITLHDEVRDEDGAVQRDLKDVIKCINIKPGQEGRNVIGSICGRKNNRVIWGAQPLASAVLTPSGWTTIGELKVGDSLVGRDGKQQHVTHLHPISNTAVYELKFSDGSVAHSTADHLWTFSQRKTGKYRHDKTERLDYFIPRLFDYGTPRWATPKSEPIEFSEVPKPLVSPYIIGALIGDGCIRQSVTLYNLQDKDIVKEVEKELPEGHSVICYRESHGQYQLRGEHGKNLITRELKRMGLLGTGSREKFLPQELLFGSLETRRSLLQGLLDTDGCVLHSTIRYTSISAQLRRDVIHLVRSLGGYARESLPFTVVINIEDFVPFRCARKIARMRPSKFKQRRKSVLSIEKISDSIPVRCITVSSDDGLYLTNDFVVTHNCDEMGHMDVGVLSARVALAPNPFNQFIGMNNAPDDGDPMYLDAEPHGTDFPDGWRSVDKDTHEEWPTKTGKCIYLNSDKCPNTLAKDPAKPPFPKLMTAEMRELTIRSAGGIDTPMAWKYIYGFPASVDIPDKVLTHKLLETNGAFQQVEWVDSSQKVLAGLDLGFREGGDPCVIHFGKVGAAVGAGAGRKVLGMEPDGVVLNPSTKVNEAYEIQIGKKVVEECRRRGCHDLALDVTGDGGILLQHIEREARAQGYALNVLPVSFSGTASDSIVIPGEKRTGAEMFHNKVAELWVSLRLSCINGVLRGMSEHGNAKQQLCSRKGSNDDKKRYSVESKRDMKKRIKRSPDHGDACALLHHLALRHGLSGMVVQQKKDPQQRLDELVTGAVGRKRYGEFGRSKYGC